jgi:hypothetical protein
LELNTFGVTESAYHVVQTKRFDVAAKSFLQVRNRYVFGFALAVGRDVGQAGGEAADFRVGDDFNRERDGLELNS